MLGGISRVGHPILTNVTTNGTRNFECHPGGESHGTVLLGLASAGVLANLSLATLIMARKSLRRWSSGLLLHGTLVDGTRAGLLIPLGLSVLRCQPVTRCSLVDTAFLLLATVASLNLLTASLSDAPLLPPPVLVPTLLESAGYSRTQSNHYASPLYPKGQFASYMNDYYDEDANLLAETTAMPDSPQCVLFGTFMVWFAALTINLGPTFLSGALAAQAEINPKAPSCPLVRGPARHAILNALWAAVNLLCVGLAAAHLRKLKKDLSRARIGLLAAAGAGLAGMAGIATPSTSLGLGFVHNAEIGRGDRPPGHTLATPSEVDSFLRQAQKNGRCHIRTLGSLATANLICWVPLYICALVAPVGTGVWEDPAPFVYELTLMAAFAHSVAHPILLLFLHQPLRDGLRGCIMEFCCCLCVPQGFQTPGSNNVDEEDDEPRVSRHSSRRPSNSRSSHHGSHHGSHHSSHHELSDPTVSLTLSLKRSSSLKNMSDMGSPSLLPMDDLLPPPPLPPANSLFRKQISLEEHSERMENRW